MLFKVQKAEQKFLSDIKALDIYETPMDLEYLMRRYGNQVLRLAFSYLQDVEEAKDASQEVFLRVFKSLDKFEGKSAPYTWIYRITVNLCLDRLRKKSRFKQQYLDENWAGACDFSPEEEVMNYFNKKLLFEAVMSLPVAFREIIVLYYLYQFDVKRIAEITGTNNALVKIRLYRGRQKLKKILLDKGVEFDER